jgi:NodT family efflux transporter outer membrane factor (OMF) lipoprotein
MKPNHSTALVRARLPQATLLAVVVLCLSACANLVDTPQSAVLRDAPSSGLPATQKETSAVAATWWRDFGDEQLNQLVQEALASNPSLKIVQARLVRAKAGAEITGAASGPQLGVGVDATRQLFTANGMIPKPLAGAIYDTATAQLTGSYELDFFGKNRAALNAALGQARAAQADADAARMLLASNVARSYFQLARLNDQLAVSDRQLAQRTQSLQLVQDRVNAGLDTKIELRQFEATLPELRLQIEALKEQLSLAGNALDALLGVPNKARTLDKRALAAIKNIATTSVLPSDLLGRRADIAAARWRVEAATQDVGNARGQFYPSVNLVAFAGFSSIGFDQLFNSGSGQWGVGPALRLPLFDGGRLRANLRGKVADLDAAIESYNATVLDAVRDVADQLASQQSVSRQQTEHQAALALAQNTHEMALQRYNAGLVNFLVVLNAEAAVLNQRRQGLDLAARALDIQVGLMRALGGGYETELPATSAKK